MRFIFVGDYLKEIGIELSQEDLAWFDGYDRGCNDLDRYLLLYALVKYNKIKTALEIGCAACWGCLAMIHGGAEKVIGIDINPKCKEVSDKLKVIEGDSKVIMTRMTKEKFELIFVDGDHDIDNVLTDLENAKRLATKYIVIHDYNLEKGVTPAVDEIFGKPKLVIKDNRDRPDLEAGLVVIKL